MHSAAAVPLRTAAGSCDPRVPTFTFEDARARAVRVRGAEEDKRIRIREGEEGGGEGREKGREKRRREKRERKEGEKGRVHMLFRVP